MKILIRKINTFFSFVKRENKRDNIKIRKGTEW